MKTNTKEMLKCPWRHLAHPTQETIFIFPSTSHSFPAIPEFHKKLSLLSFWTKCCSPVGVYHSSADRVIKQLEVSFAKTVNKEYPGLAEAGTDGSKKASSSSSFPATWVAMGTQKGQLWKKKFTRYREKISESARLQKDSERALCQQWHFFKVLYWFFLLPWQNTRQKLLIKERSVLVTFQESQSPPGRDGMAAEAGWCKVKGAWDW